MSYIEKQKHDELIIILAELIEIIQLMEKEEKIICSFRMRMRLESGLIF